MKTSKSLRSPTPTDLNRASATMLRSMLPGVGEVLAARIAEHRVSYGPYAGPSDLARVPGIGEKRASRLWASLAPEARIAAAASEPEISELCARPTDPAPFPRPARLPRLALASEAPTWFEEAEAVSQTSLASDSLPPPQVIREAGARGLRARLGFVALAALGVGAVAIGTFALADAIRSRATEAAHADVASVREEVRGSQSAIEEVRAAQAGADARATRQYEAIMKRLDDGDRRADEAARARALIEKRARKIEETQLALASKVGQVEDGLLWQKLVSAARGAQKPDPSRSK